MLFFSTSIGGGKCMETFEQEIDANNPTFSFADSSLQDAGCDVADGGTMHRGDWTKGDCSYATWSWSCPVKCEK